MPVTDPAGLPRIDVEGLAATLRPNTSLLLTASSALAADWKRRLVESTGSGVCATPLVCSWGQWLTTLAAEDDDVAVPLTGFQEQLLWERVIRSDPRGGESATARGLARHASHAYALMREYRIDDRELAGQGEEAEALARWISGMRRELAAMDRVLAADLAELLLPELGRRMTGKHVLLDGFVAFTPMQQALLQTLQDGGVRLETLRSEDAAATPQLSCWADAEVEYRQLAQAIADHLESAPQTRIGVLLSRQVKDTGRLRRILNETLLPDDVATTAMREGLQATQMAGEPLSAAPMVSQSMRLLQMAGKTGAAFAELSPLLFSPGLKGHAAEREARAALDATLRETNRHYVGFKSLLAMQEMQHMPQLSSVLKALLVWDVAARSVGEWVRAVHALLQQAGYLEAEVEGRSSSDIRQLNAFRECLAAVVVADAVNARMGWTGFLSLLGTSLQARSLDMPAHYPGVHVLPLEQIPGLRFDVVFVTGLDEEALPLPARPAPLLPFSVQRRFGLPGATAAQAYEDSLFLWRQVLQSAPVVHVSFARNLEERELHPSPLLAGQRVEFSESEAVPDESLACEDFEDAPPVVLTPAERIRGGSGIVKDQSACPFRAFATHRLGIAPLGETSPGIEPKAKGSLLHAALEYFWTHVRSQAELVALDERGVAELIEAAVRHAWEQVHVSAPSAAQDFERRRMIRVLGQWLEKERERPPFLVEQCEKSYRLCVPEDGALRFPVRLKADRIDRDSEGHRILIDYKSGRKQSVSAWIGERMEEPQLPLYSMAERLGVADAVCFARVRSDDMGFEGLSGEDVGITGIAMCDGKRNRPEDWAELLAAWRRDINALAGEFVAGRAEVAPRNPVACAYCGLEAVCRIAEIGFASEDDDDAGEEA